MQTTWQQKAHRIIGALSRQSFLAANQLPSGKMRAKHVPYSIPQEALDLIECMNTGDEHGAKTLMMHDYTVSKLSI